MKLAISVIKADVEAEIFENSYSPVNLANCVRVVWVAKKR